jgi:hypothetical protein
MRWATGADVGASGNVVGGRRWRRVRLATGGDFGDGWRRGWLVAKSGRSTAMWVMGKGCRIKRRNAKRGATVTSCPGEK